MSEMSEFHTSLGAELDRISFKSIDDECYFTDVESDDDAPVKDDLAHPVLPTTRSSAKRAYHDPGLHNSKRRKTTSTTN